MNRDCLDSAVKEGIPRSKAADILERVMPMSTTFGIGLPSYMLLQLVSG